MHHNTGAFHSVPQSSPTYPSVNTTIHSGFMFFSFMYSDTQLGLVPPPPLGLVALMMSDTAEPSYTSCPATSQSQYSKSTWDGFTSSAIALTSDKNSLISSLPIEPDVSMAIVILPIFSPTKLGIYTSPDKNRRLTLRQDDLSLALHVALTKSRNTSRQFTLGSKSSASSLSSPPAPSPALLAAMMP